MVIIVLYYGIEEIVYFDIVVCTSTYIDTIVYLSQISIVCVYNSLIIINIRVYLYILSLPKVYVVQSACYSNILVLLRYLYFKSISILLAIPSHYFSAPTLSLLIIFKNPKKVKINSNKLLLLFNIVLL